MATISSRLPTLKAVIDSIAPQLSVLYVYLNDHKKIPSFFDELENVVPILGKSRYGDLNANGKMMFLEQEHSGIAFTLDDDIIYPENYVSSFLSAFENFDNRAVLTVHGSVIPDMASWYYERSCVYPMREALEKRMPVNLVGSGTCAFPIDRLALNAENFKNLVFVDLHISLAALKAGIPLVAIDRPALWLTPVAYEGLWEQFKAEITHHTHILRSETVWKSFSLRKIWTDFFDSLRDRGVSDPIAALNLSTDVLGFANDEFVSSSSDDLIFIKKYYGFNKLWGRK